MQSHLTNSETSQYVIDTNQSADEVLSHAKLLLSERAYKKLRNYLDIVSEENFSSWSVSEQFELHWFLAEAYFFVQDNSGSFQYAQKGLELAETLSKEEQSKAHHQIGRNYAELGASQQALEHLLLAHELRTQTDPCFFNAMGVVYYQRKNYDEAKIWYERALEFSKDDESEDGLWLKGALHQNFSFIAFEQGDYASSLNYSLKALDFSKRASRPMEIRVHYAIIKNYLYLGDLQNAEKHYQAALTLEEEVGAAKTLESYLQPAALFEAKEQFSEAENMLLEGIEFIKENLDTWLSTAYEQLINLYKKQGKYREALEVSETRYNVKVEQLNHSFDEQTTFLLSKVQHDMVKQEREFYRTQSRILSEDLTEAQAQAQKDALTGIYNRAYFDYIAQILFDSSQNLKQPLSILLIDIDHFKKVNDTFGHLIGDEVLRTIASLMELNVRKEDVLARFGGEEFVILLPNASEQLAMVVAEKIRTTIEKYDWESITENLKVTLSIGIKQCTDSLHLSLDQADKRLYQAKELGRNRCVSDLVLDDKL